jgi:gamma-glutamyl-gamma-aminobutyrate hydrolase PuuD
MVGICRGAQLLTAIAGGYLVQDVTNHTRTHEIVDTRTNEKVAATSAHHQMCVPNFTTHEVWATVSPNNLSAHYVYDKNKVTLPKDFVEPEVIYYPNIKALAIQGHPEFVGTNNPYAIYCRKLFRQFIERVY